MTIKWANKECTYISGFVGRQKCLSSNGVKTNKAMSLCDTKIRSTKRQRIKRAKEIMKNSDAEIFYFLPTPHFSPLLQKGSNN